MLTGPTLEGEWVWQLQWKREGKASVAVAAAAAAACALCAVATEEERGWSEFEAEKGERTLMEIPLYSRSQMDGKRGGGGGRKWTQGERK